jgi:hypothetical protein
MKAGATAKSSTTGGKSSIDQNVERQSHEASFAKVVDGRKQPVRGLWERNGRFYAQLRIENPITGIKKTLRVPLVDKDGAAVPTVAQAVSELKTAANQASRRSTGRCRADAIVFYLCGVISRIH